MAFNQHRAQRLENIAHYMTAFVIFMKGFDKIEQPGKLGFAVLFIAIALLIVSGTIFHHRAERMLRHFKAYVFVFEAIVMSIVGYLYMKEGKQMIQYVCFASALVFLVALVIYITKTKGKPAEHHERV
jgi:hypothetical protein